MPERLYHEFGPLYTETSKILILGSFPSVKSREQQFYYGHPQNRFWKIIAALCDAAFPQTIDEKKKLILDNGFALWDVIESCEITGSSDSTIKNAVVNDLSTITNHSPIKLIAVNGTAAYNLYLKYDIPKHVITKSKIITRVHTTPSTDIYTNPSSDAYIDPSATDIQAARNTNTIPAVKLPSSSPANAAWSLPRLTEEWQKLLFSVK